jgi:hypothetical protein
LVVQLPDVPTDLIGDPLSCAAALERGDGHLEVYLVTNGQRRHVLNDIIMDAFFDRSQIEVTPEPPSVPDGPPIGVLPDFEIGFWCGPPNAFMETSASRVFQDIRNAGFTFASPACNETYEPDNVRKFLEAARDAGLRAVIADNRISAVISACDGAVVPIDYANIESLADSVVSDFSAFSNLAGYLLADEPSDTDSNYMQLLGRLVARLRLRDPARFAWINLLPFGYSAIGVDEGRYQAYLENILNVVGVDLITFDHYPVDWAGDDTSPTSANYTANLRLVRDACAAHAKPFWTLVLSFPYGGLPEGVSEERLRWQVTEALRYGTSGIVYWTYWTPPCASFDGRPALVDRDGNPTTQYDVVNRLNPRTSVL